MYSLSYIYCRGQKIGNDREEEKSVISSILYQSKIESANDRGHPASSVLPVVTHPISTLQKKPFFPSSSSGHSQGSSKPPNIPSQEKGDKGKYRLATLCPPKEQHSRPFKNNRVCLLFFLLRKRKCSQTFLVVTFFFAGSFEKGVGK